MSQTWVIKDTAPVDEDSAVLNKIDISFTSGGKEFIGIEINDGDESYMGYNLLTYYSSNGTVVQPAYFEYSTGGMSQFSWKDPAYRTLEFGTAPTGELLAWLQKNADKYDPEYLTRKSELTSIANAIRNKSGITSQLIYPDGFISTINAITTVSPKLATITFSIASNSSIDPRFVFATYISQNKELINEGSAQSSIQDRTSPFNIQTIQDSLLFMYHSGSASLAVSNSSGMQYSNSGGGIYLIPQAEICTCELFYPGD